MLFLVLVMFSFVTDLLRWLGVCTCQEIGWEDSLQNDLYCVKQELKPDSSPLCAHHGVLNVFWTEMSNVGSLVLNVPNGHHMLY